MPVAQLLALAAATSGAAARDLSVSFFRGNATVPVSNGPRRLDTLDKRGYSDEEITAFGKWAEETFDRPWDGNLFIGADYMHAELDCRANTQTGWYKDIQYVRYHFFCGGWFWSERDSLTAAAGNVEITDHGAFFS